VVVLHPFITGQVQRFGNATIDKQNSTKVVGGRPGVRSSMG